MGCYTALVEELETPVESVKEIATSVFHHLKSMKDLCGTKARWEKLKNSRPRFGTIRWLRRSLKWDFCIRSWRGNCIRSHLRCFSPEPPRRWFW
ncbi:hypothetical protein GW17_00049289 [Ensete ventricosum]|uniref:Uncharacterized protein n=1 Tax=Ensete ventricosum TaxID=4639 RepID=A0A444CRV9_ENSVE|nr:hypothetical protein GW17_00049289 [Ensete ventricosum]RZR73437.1 hypothetical protein BHM03_00024190 [Ensete ventricosum]